MRLLLVSSWFPFPPDNGSKLRAYNILRELSKHHTLTLLSFAEPHEAAPEHLEPLNEICETVTIVRGHPFKHGRLGLAGLLSEMPRSFVQTYSAEMKACVDRALPGHDLAIGLEVGSALYLRDIHAVPRVFEGAEVTWLRARRDLEQDLARRFRLMLTWRKYSRFIRNMVASFERTTVVSDVEREAFIRMGCDPARVSVVPNGVAGADAAPATSPETRLPRLIYPGAMTYSANHDAVRMFLTSIWPLIRRARPTLSFWVTGSTTGVDMRSLPAGEGVTFTGHVADVKQLVAESAACVVPLRTGGGTRLKILEAMDLGTPVVSTSKGAEGLAVTPDRDILIADRPEEFAGQVLRLLDDPGLADRLSRNGRDLVQRLHTWDTIGRQLEKVIQEAVETFHQGRRPR